MAFLLGRRNIVTALLDGSTRRIRWWRAPRASTSTMPGLADVDGDGKLEVASVGVVGSGPCLWCADLATGKLEWQMPLPKPQATDFATGDINGDGLAELVFASERTLYAVNGRGGKANVIWNLRLPHRCGPPILADVDADGRAEVLLVTDDGHLRCIDGRRPHASRGGGQPGPRAPQP